MSLSSESIAAPITQVMISRTHLLKRIYLNMVCLKKGENKWHA